MLGQGSQRHCRWGALVVPRNTCRNTPSPSARQPRGGQGTAVGQGRAPHGNHRCARNGDGHGGAGRRAASPHLLPTTPEPAAQRAPVRGWGNPHTVLGLRDPHNGWETPDSRLGLGDSSRHPGAGGHLTWVGAVGTGWGGGLGTPLHPAVCDTKPPLTRSSSADLDLDLDSHVPDSSLPNTASRAGRHALLLLEKKVKVSAPLLTPPALPPGMGFTAPSGTRGGFVLPLAAGGCVLEKEREIPLL